MDIKTAISKVIEGKSLSFEEMTQVATEIMEGNTTDAQIGALLVALHLKGETVDEITGFARAMRSKVTKIPCQKNRLVDTCGTGGDKSGTFNVSTVSAFVASGAGCRVAKHGNRSITSQCGSADLFKALNVNVEIPAEKMGECIDQNGIGFLFAPLLHPAMKYAIGPRREIGVRTIFNILGPLTNPAGAKRQLMGVFQNSLTVTLASVLQQLGSEHVMVVHGEDGLDEITITGKTYISESRNGEIRNYTISPEDFGLKSASLNDIKGGSPEDNVRIAQEILSGKEGAPLDIVSLNAGAVIYVAGKADSIQDGIVMARESIQSGAAMRKLEALQEMTNL